MPDLHGTMHGTAIPMGQQIPWGQKSHCPKIEGKPFPMMSHGIPWLMGSLMSFWDWEDYSVLGSIGLSDHRKPWVPIFVSRPVWTRLDQPKVGLGQHRPALTCVDSLDWT